MQQETYLLGVLVLLLLSVSNGIEVDMIQKDVPTGSVSWGSPPDHLSPAPSQTMQKGHSGLELA